MILPLNIITLTLIKSLAITCLSVMFWLLVLLGYTSRKIVSFKNKILKKWSTKFFPSLIECIVPLQAMAVAGMSADGRHRSIDHPKVLRTPPDSPARVRASYPTPGWSEKLNWLTANCHSSYPLLCDRCEERLPKLGASVLQKGWSHERGTTIPQRFCWTCKVSWNYMMH